MALTEFDLYAMDNDAGIREKQLVIDEGGGKHGEHGDDGGCDGYGGGDHLWFLSAAMVDGPRVRRHRLVFAPRLLSAII